MALLLGVALMASVAAACADDRTSNDTTSSDTASTDRVQPPTELALTEPDLPLSGSIGLNDSAVPTVAGFAPGENLVTMFATLALAQRLPEPQGDHLGDVQRLETATRDRIEEMTANLDGGSIADEAALFADVLLLARGEPRLIELIPEPTKALLAETVAGEPEISVTALRLRSGLLVAGSPVPEPTPVLDDRLCLAADVTSLGYTDALPLLAGEISSGRLSCVVEMLGRIDGELDADPALTPAQAGNLSLGGIGFDRSGALGEVSASIANGGFPPNETMRLLARISAGTPGLDPIKGLEPLVAASVATVAGLPEVGPEDSPLEAYLYAELDAARGRPLWSTALDPSRILAAAGAASGLELIAAPNSELVGPVGGSCEERLDLLVTSARDGYATDPVRAGIPAMWPLRELAELPADVGSCPAAVDRLATPDEGSVGEVWASVYAGCAVAQTAEDEAELRRKAEVAVGDHAVDWDFIEDPYNASGMFDHYALDWLDALGDGSCTDLTLWDRHAR